jgi:ribose transport system ATP-binding protein
MAKDLFFEARNLSKRFGPQQALCEVSINVRSGQIHAIIGENGAGKSTLMNILTGKFRPSAGELYLNGKGVLFTSPLQAHRAGIAMAPQEINLCPLLSVAENVALGRQVSGKLGIDWQKTFRYACQHLEEIDATINPRARVAKLSAAHQQLVQIARATATQADVLIFDEPTAALTDRETETLFKFMVRFRAKGGAIFYISHRLDEILQVADRITVLRDGRSVAELDPKRTDKNEMVRLMAGREVNSWQRQHPPRRPVNDVMLKVDDLTRAQEFREVSFQVYRGEILAISGLIGSGRTELGKCLFGVTQPERGQIQIDGRAVRHRCPADAIRQGLVYLPEERKREGIFPLLTVRENICVAALSQFLTFFGLRRGEMTKIAEQSILQLGIRTSSPRSPIMNLSGGNQQKAILARWLLTKCRILILDEPTRGIDVNAKFEIQTFLRSLVEAGLTIIYISSELIEILQISDRILVMHEGRVKGVLDTATATQDRVLGLAMA